MRVVSSWYVLPPSPPAADWAHVLGPSKRVIALGTQLFSILDLLFFYLDFLMIFDLILSPSGLDS